MGIVAFLLLHCETWVNNLVFNDLDLNLNHRPISFWYAFFFSFLFLSSLKILEHLREPNAEIKKLNKLLQRRNYFSSKYRSTICLFFFFNLHIAYILFITSLEKEGMVDMNFKRKRHENVDKLMECQLNINWRAAVRKICNKAEKSLLDAEFHIFIHIHVIGY